jgi:hypothetical protein
MIIFNYVLLRSFPLLLLDLGKRNHLPFAFHIIMDNDKGETVVLPTKLIADKEIIIESGPQPEIPEKKVERMTEGVDRQSERKQ